MPLGLYPSGSLPANQPVDRAVEGGHVDVVVGADAERARVVDVEADRVVVPRTGGVRGQAADVALVEVRVDVAPAQRAERVIADHHAAGDRASAAPAVRLVVRVLEDRGAVAVLGPRGIVVAGEVEPVPPLEVVPAEVRAAKRLAALEVNLLPAVLADVAD